MMVRAAIIFTITLIVIALDATTGAFPVSMFVFPLNILVMTLWAMTILYVYRNRATSPIAKFLLSREATWLSLAIMAVIGIVLGLQRNPASDSWSVIAGILFVMSHLLCVVLRGWQHKQHIRWRFTMLHIGLLLALGAGFWGAPDREQLRIAVKQHPSRKAYTIEGVASQLPYDITLNEFHVETSQNGTPENYTADVRVDGTDVVLRVNHPYNHTLSEKIYLINGGVSQMGNKYAILEVVREPWQWFSVLGIVMLITGAALLFIRGPKERR